MDEMEMGETLNGEMELEMSVFAFYGFSAYSKSNQDPKYLLSDYLATAGYTHTHTHTIYCMLHKHLCQ